MKRALLFSLLIATAVALGAGCGGDGDSGDRVKIPTKDEKELALRVDDYTITKRFLIDYIRRLPPEQRNEYDSDEGRARMADRFIEDELYHQEAIKENLESDELVEQQLKDAKRGILISAYFRKHVRAKASPTEREMRDYYDENIDRYTYVEERRAQHILCTDEDEILNLRERIVEGGESFTKLAFRHSEESLTKQNGGETGLFSRGGYITGVGFNEALSESLFAMEQGVVSEPIKWKKGYSLFVITEIHPATVQPYPEVRDRIEDSLTDERVEEARASVVEGLIEGYETRNFMREYYLSIYRDPKELFAIAQRAPKARDKISIYEDIVARFPDDEMAPKAQFMVGFVYAEELGDYISAGQAFGRVLTNYPDTEVADQAKWMMDHMGEALPEFEAIEEDVKSTD